MNVDDENQRTKGGLNKAFFERNGNKVTDRHFDRIIEKARDIEDKAKSISTLHKLFKYVLLISAYRSGRHSCSRLLFGRCRRHGAYFETRNSQYELWQKNSPSIEIQLQSL